MNKFLVLTESAQIVSKKSQNTTGIITLSRIRVFCSVKPKKVEAPFFSHTYRAKEVLKKRTVDLWLLQ